jgi:hypothetical protein
MQTNFVLVLAAIIGSMGGLLIAASMETYAQSNTNTSMTGSAEPGTEPGAEPGTEPGAEPRYELGTEPGVEPCK